MRSQRSHTNVGKAKGFNKVKKTPKGKRPSLSHKTMFKKPSRTKNIRRKVETEEEPNEGKQEKTLEKTKSLTCKQRSSSKRL